MTSVSYVHSSAKQFYSSLFTKMWNALDIALTPEKPFTDYMRWRLLVGGGGRHTWHYPRIDEEGHKPKSRGSGA